MSETRGFTNIHIINLSLKELFFRLRPQRIRQFASSFELTKYERDKSLDPAIRAQRIARRLADHYRISVSAIVVTFRSNMDVPGRVHLSPSSEFFIELHSEHRNALAPTVAILAHEVAHIFLYRAGISLQPTFHNEVLTDTTAVFLGCGPAILNAATKTTTTSGNVITTTTRKFGYLSVDEFGYIQAKREAFFGLRHHGMIAHGLSRLGYQRGCWRFRRERWMPPFQPSRFLLRTSVALGLLQPLPVDQQNRITFPCAFCSQSLRVPRLGKQMLIRCPTCEEKLVCQT
jgi:predicted SprT family Zn-dependent metalloprotease